MEKFSKKELNSLKAGVSFATSGNGKSGGGTCWFGCRTGCRPGCVSGCKPGSKEGVQ